MKILVISDTHGDKHRMEHVIANNQDVDLIIHCGDSELEAAYFDNKEIQIVRGNCDFDEHYPEERILELNQERFLVVHGHKHNVKSTLMPLFYRAKEVEATVVCFGHSHLLGAELQDGILFVNPGSLTNPRGRKEKSYALLEKNDSNWIVTFFNEENKEIEKGIF